MSRTVSIVSNQDAVGKSTTAWYLACNLATIAGRTLLVDCDPLSGLATRLPGQLRADGSLNLCDDAIGMIQTVTAVSERMHVLAGNADLVTFELKAAQMPEREQRLKSLLGSRAEEYDYIVIDTPSSLGLLTLNALVASDSVIVPLCCDYFGMDGVAEVMRTIKTVNREWNDRLRLEGLLLTRYDDSLRSTERNVKEYCRLFGDFMFDTVIRESNNPDSDYAELTRELLLRTSKN